MKELVYISGKIGEEVLSEATRQKFVKAEKALHELGYDVFNPTRSGLGATAEVLAIEKGTDFYREILLLDLDMLAKCDAIYMMPDWTDSPGAKVEKAYAEAIGIKVLSVNLSIF